MLAAPWLWLLWATRPGADRPLVRDVVSVFFLLSALVLQSAVERIMERKRRHVGLYEAGLALLSAALLSWRIHQVSYLLLFASLIPVFALGHVLVEWLFRSRRSSEA